MKKTGTRTGDLFLMWVYFLLELRRNKNSVKLSQILRAEKETIQVCSVIPVNSNKQACSDVELNHSEKVGMLQNVVKEHGNCCLDLESEHKESEVRDKRDQFFKK